MSIDGKINPFDEKIIAAGKQAQNIAMAESHGNDAKRNDLDNTLHNAKSFLMRFTALIKSIGTGPPPILGYVLRGLNDGLKNGDDNLVNDLSGALAGTAGGLINGVHRQQAHDVGQILSSK